MRIAGQEEFRRMCGEGTAEEDLVFRIIPPAGAAAADGSRSWKWTQSAAFWPLLRKAEASRRWCSG